MIFFVHIFQSFTEVSARKKQLVQMEKDFDTSPFALLFTESQHLLWGTPILQDISQPSTYIIVSE